MAPPAPYTCTPEILQRATDLALAHGVPLLIHLAETAQEVQDARREFGLSPVEWADRAGVFRARTVAAHCVHVTEEDLDLLVARGVGVARGIPSRSGGVAAVVGVAVG